MVDNNFKNSTLFDYLFNLCYKLPSDFLICFSVDEINIIVNKIKIYIENDINNPSRNALYSKIRKYINSDFVGVNLDDLFEIKQQADNIRYVYDIYLNKALSVFIRLFNKFMYANYSDKNYIIVDYESLYWDYLDFIPEWLSNDSNCLYKTDGFVSIMKNIDFIDDITTIYLNSFANILRRVFLVTFEKYSYCEKLYYCSTSSSNSCSTNCLTNCSNNTNNNTTTNDQKSKNGINFLAKCYKFSWNHGVTEFTKNYNTTGFYNISFLSDQLNHDSIINIEKSLTKRADIFMDNFIEKYVGLFIKKFDRMPSICVSSIRDSFEWFKDVCFDDILYTILGFDTLLCQFDYRLSKYFDRLKTTLDYFEKKIGHLFMIDNHNYITDTIIFTGKFDKQKEIKTVIDWEYKSNYIQPIMRLYFEKLKKKYVMSRTIIDDKLKIRIFPRNKF